MFFLNNQEQKHFFLNFFNVIFAQDLNKEGVPKQ